MSKIADRSSWKNLPLSSQRDKLKLKRAFSKDEYGRLSKGLIPEGMEDKWFIFMENNVLYFHRSWTGFCIYEAHFDGNQKIQEVWVNRDSAQYDAHDNDYDEKLLMFLIDDFLLKREIFLPVSSNIPDDSLTEGIKPSKTLDYHTILIITFRNFLWWFITVLLVSFFGNPGVVCMTPLAWFLALQVGNQVAWTSKSSLRSQRLTEAAIAGGLLGVLQSILFGAIILFLAPIQSYERLSAIYLVILMASAGIIVGVGFSFFTASLIENRRYVQR